MRPTCIALQFLLMLVCFTHSTIPKGTKGLPAVYSTLKMNRSKKQFRNDNFFNNFLTKGRQSGQANHIQQVKNDCLEGGKPLVESFEN